ncbi:MAG: RNA pseudouridine synthase [Acidobacteria bacterium]|nr:MAG: RNA pseudouridine synthase [Acidobacteriota bacterium]
MGRNHGYTYREQLARSAQGRALSDFLVDRYRHSSEQDWIERIRQGRVRIDGAVAEPATRLAAGQWLSWERPGWIEPPAALGFGVLYEHGDVVAIAKPSGLPTLPGAGFLEHTLLHQLRRHREGLHPLHRLGRHTSGIVLCVAAGESRVALSRAWSQGRVRKTYRALASGEPPQSTFEIATPIGPVPYAPLGTLNAASPAGKPARSTVRVVERREREFLCDVEIATGRPHQIRIHLAAAGHPLVGDPLYAEGGVPPTHCRAVPGDGGYALHAMELRFTHPITENAVTVRCIPPSRLRSA